MAKIDLPEEILVIVDTISAETGETRSAVIERMVKEYIAEARPKTTD